MKSEIKDLFSAHWWPWIAVAAAGGIALRELFKKPPAAPTPATSSDGNIAPHVPEITVVGFDPTVSYGETQKVPLAVPTGWRRVTSAEVSALPELRTRATALRNTAGFTSMAYGTLTPFSASDGNTYATWIEQHYHEPGGPVKPWGLHHGVTLLAQKDTSVLSDEWLGVRFNG